MSRWRSNAFYLTRNRGFLTKGIACIIGFFIAVAFSVHFIFPTETPENTAGIATTAFGELQQSSKMLLRAPDKSPGRLVSWMKDAAAELKQLPPSQRPPFDEVRLQLGDINVKELIEHHVPDSLQRELFYNYARCIFAGGSSGKDRAREFLRVQAGAIDAARHANALHADLLVLENKQKEALHFYLREAVHPDASDARLMAARLAIALKDTDALAQLARNKDFITSCSSSMLLKMAGLLDDRALLLRGLWAMQWDRLSQFTGLLVALFSAALWLVILTTSTGLRLRQAGGYIPALLAGMLSVWVLHTLQVLLQYDVDLSFDAGLSVTHRIFYWVMDVGVPEEAVKIALFVPFLPLMLAQRSTAKAALTAGCVGLGFSLNENLQYYQDYGVIIAISRLLTANIIHISLTGILGYELYLLFESRFHRAVDFLLAFGAVALAHGLYDFCNSESNLEGLEIGGIIIVAFAARWYLQRLHAPCNAASAQPVSRTGIFCFGSSLLVGVLMVVAVLETNSLMGITLVLKEAVGLATVALIYIREFKEI